MINREHKLSIVRQGFVYLCAVVDWLSRRVLSLRLSITAAFCLEAVEEALARYLTSSMPTRDQFTSTDLLQCADVGARIRFS